MDTESMEVTVGKHEVKLESLEDNVKELWTKWNRVQTLLIGTLISALGSLAGIIFLLVR